MNGEQMLEFFNENNQAAAKIADQNLRYEDLLTDPLLGDEPDFYEAAEQGLVLEQNNTVQELASLDKTPYLLVDPELESAEGELATLQEQLASREGLDDERIAHIRAVAERAIALAPLSEIAVGELENSRVEDIRRLTEAELARLVVLAEARLQRAQELSDVSAQAWPLPKVGMIFEQVETLKPPLRIVFEFPVEPEAHEIHEITERFINRHGRTHKASYLAVEYLVRHQNMPLTAEDIGSIYTNEGHFTGLTPEERLNTIRQRVQSLLHKRNSHIPAFLLEEGLALQYGLQRFLRPDGKNFCKPHVAYRVGPYDPAASKQDKKFEIIENVDEDGNRMESAANREAIDEREMEIREAYLWLEASGLLPGHGKYINRSIVHRRLISLPPELKQSDFYSEFRKGLGSIGTAAGVKLDARALVFGCIKKSKSETHNTTKFEKLLGYITEVVEKIVDGEAAEPRSA